MIVRITGDEPEERDLYAFALRQTGLMVEHQVNLTSMIDRWESAPIDLVVALRPEEANLPDSVARFRDVSRAPLVLLLESPGHELHLRCVRAGADLVLELPTEPRLLAAYCLNLLRRFAGLTPNALPSIETGHLRLLPATRSVSISGSDPIRLTPLEFRMLFLLMSHRGQVVETEDLVERVWGYADSGSRELARGLVSRLRTKLGDKAKQPRFIETIPGVGYRIPG